MLTGCSAISTPGRVLATPSIPLACDLHGADSGASRNRTVQLLTQKLHESCGAESGVLPAVGGFGTGRVGRIYGRRPRAIHIITYPLTIPVLPSSSCPGGSAGAGEVGARITGG